MGSDATRKEGLAIGVLTHPRHLAPFHGPHDIAGRPGVILMDHPFQAKARLKPHLPSADVRGLVFIGHLAKICRIRQGPTIPPTGQHISEIQGIARIPSRMPDMLQPFDADRQSLHFKW